MEHQSAAPDIQTQLQNMVSKAESVSNRNMYCLMDQASVCFYFILYQHNKFHAVVKMRAEQAQFI